MEVASQVTMDVSSGFIYIARDKCTSVAAFDLKVFRRIVDLERDCFPVKMVASHICSLPLFTRKVVKPIIFAMMSKRTRSRSRLHDVAEKDCAQVLSNFGITNDMLPTDMGGTLELNITEWVSQRQAVELKDI